MTNNLIIDTRSDMYAFGIDFGSDSKVLVLNDLVRLVWSKGHSTLIGARGCGHSHKKSTLSIRTFKQDVNGISYLSSKEIFTGGKLSKERLLEIKDIIDNVFGTGTTEKISNKETLVIGQDLVSDYVKKYHSQKTYINDDTRKEVDKIFAGIRNRK